MRNGGAVFVVNPASAKGKTGKRWPQIAARAAAAGLHGESRMSHRVGQIAEIAKEAAESGAQLVIAVGGDGTVSEIVHGLLTADRRPSPELAIIPCGTGSD